VFQDSGKRLGWGRVPPRGKGKGKGKGKASAKDVLENSYRVVRKLLTELTDEGFIHTGHLTQLLTKESWLADWAEENPDVCREDNPKLRDTLMELIMLWLQSLA
jgi:hypothetical protein